MGTPPVAPSLPPTQTEDRLDRYARLVMQIGIPSVFAGVMLWFMITRLLSNLDIMTTEMRTQTKMIEHIESVVADCKKPGA